jgi:hypothetical protein
MKKIVMIVALVFPFLNSAQTQEAEDVIQHSTLTSYDFRDKNLKGSMYVNDEPQVARISDSEKLYAMRFNAYQNEMEFERDGKPYFLPKRFNYKVVFEETGKTYKVFGYDDKKNQKKLGFFVVLHESPKLTLLAMERIEFEEQEKPQTGYHQYKPPTLRRIKDKLYIGYPNFMTSEVPAKKKDIIKLFGSRAKEIESYAKANRIGFKKGKDLAKLFAHFDTL